MHVDLYSWNGEYEPLVVNVGELMVLKIIDRILVALRGPTILKAKYTGTKIPYKTLIKVPMLVLLISVFLLYVIRATLFETFL